MIRCDNCGAPLRVDPDRGLFVCDHCGSQKEAPPYVAHVTVDSDTTLPCPVCSTPLSNARLAGHALLYCRACHGTLIDMSRFNTVIDALRSLERRAVRVPLPADQRPCERTIACPRCGRTMLNHLYAGPGNVVIDTCETCLVNWLDAGEVRRIAIAPYSPYSDRRSAGD